jgi:hypothetical protein
MSSGVLTLRVNQTGEPEFDVRVRVGPWESVRTVTVTDPAVDVADLLWAIAARRTEVTDVDRRDGDVTWHGWEKSRTLGRWVTKSTFGEATSVAFSLPLANGRDIGFAPLVDPASKFFTDEDVAF